MPPALAADAPAFATLDTYEFKSRSARDLLAFWNRLRGREPVAPWDRFDPLDLAGLLPRMVIGELTGPDKVIARLVGSEVVALYGADFTGANLIALDGQPDPEGFRDMYRQIALGDCAYAADVVYGTLNGVDARCEFVNLPMICAQGRVTRVLISVEPLWGPQPVARLDEDGRGQVRAERVRLAL